ncbi:hypothetical protein IPJ72_02710 [Candidatus Peregrinibacteria bacterium]|nr:MAG: hypothetical protein IPJ72_02710 [Candidatus Peregrinibacteria bacterium]
MVELKGSSLEVTLTIELPYMANNGAKGACIHSFSLPIDLPLPSVDTSSSAIPATQTGLY